MEELKVIGWAMWLIIATFLMYSLVGISGIVNMFPEGRRWWQSPTQMASIIHFACVVLLNPFGL